MGYIGQLGRQYHDPVRLAKVPMLARYAAQAPLAPPPKSQDWYSKISYWPMLKNDLLGDCTAAGVLHAIQQWQTYATGKLWTPTDDLAIFVYSLFGFDPKRPTETDNGAVELDVLNLWLKGFNLNGNLDTLAAYASINVKNSDELRYAITWFGCAYLGIDLPKTVDTPLGDIEWDITSIGLVGQGTKGSLGPHCVIAVGYDEIWIYVISWGKLIRMSWAFWLAYGDEAYALLSSDFTRLPGVTPANIPWNELVHEWDTLRPGSLIS